MHSRNAPFGAGMIISIETADGEVIVSIVLVNAKCNCAKLATFRAVARCNLSSVPKHASRKYCKLPHEKRWLDSETQVNAKI